jgi:AcrR family transcriptional regulator
MPGDHPVGLRERKKLDTRMALSDAALELAFERGLDNVTREEIAARAGVSVRTFTNYFTNKFEAVAYRQTERVRRSLIALRERPLDEPLWTSITEAVMEPLERDGLADMPPTPRKLAVLREVLESPEARMAVSKEVFVDSVDVIAERTRTDPVRDIYPRLVAAVVRAVAEAAMDAYVHADPPIHITTLLRRGLAAVAAGLPDPNTR